MQFLAGYKTYIVGAASILSAIAAYVEGQLGFPAASQLILTALVGMGLRSGIATEVQQVFLALGIVVPPSPTPAQVLKASPATPIAGGPASGLSNAASRAMPTLAAIAVFGMMALGLLSACATAGSSPQDQLSTIEAGFGLAEATYDGICATPVPPSFCADHASYDKAKTAIEAAFATAQAAIDAGQSGNIPALIATVVEDWVAYNQIVNGMKAKDAVRRGVAYHAIPL